ncbi:hypothetical protein TNCV_3145571 [Trichonephila clavipes]|nr:hypothetical protein TNCV_3145571 [Trichonephila clavipes]
MFPTGCSTYLRVDKLRSETAESILKHEHLVEISTNEELKPMFEQGYHKFWFTSSQKKERKKEKKKKPTAREDLRLLLTNIETDINILITSHQIHPSR